MQRRAAPLDELLAVIRSHIHQRTQLLLRLGEREPCLLHADAERTLKERQGKPLVTIRNHTLGIRIAGKRGERRLKMWESAVLAVEIVVGVAHAEVPEMIAREIVRVRREKADRLFKIGAITSVRRIVVGACKLTVEFRRALLGGQCLDLRNDLLIFFVLVPNLALFE